MATTPLTFSPLPTSSIAYSNLSTASLIKSHRNHSRTIVTASVSGKSQPLVSTSKSSVPIRKIPGDYGLPLIGPLRDRLSYFYFEGRDEFFKSRVRKYGSTVLRVNMPPGPTVARDPRVIALLDAASFPVLFDTSLVEKRDLFTGTYMPSTDMTGGFRVLSYLDPSEPHHAPLKMVLFNLLASRRHEIIPQFRSTFGSLFENLEEELARKGKADFCGPNDLAAFDFLSRAMFGRDPAETKLGRDAPKLISKWILFQLGPLLTLGLPPYLEDLLLHSFRLPHALVKSDYNRLAEFFRKSAGPVMDEAIRLGISQDEAIHNLVFAICFNTFGGLKFLFPSLIKWIGRGGGKLHGKLAQEIRSAVRDAGGVVSMCAIEESMPLTKSVVYETLRIEPPVAMQYARAKHDMVIQSHDAGYEVKAGEMLFG
jgi:hydroperoxide dehydratase